MFCRKVLVCSARNKTSKSKFTPLVLSVNLWFFGYPFCTQFAHAQSPVEELPQYQVQQLLVGGRDDTTGIAVMRDVPGIGDVYVTTDSYEETCEIRDLQTQTLIADFSLGELRDEFGVPGYTSGGPDGMTAVTEAFGHFYVLATSEGSDAIFRISADGSTRELFSTVEVFNRGDYFSLSDITARSPDQFYVGERCNDGTMELTKHGLKQRPDHAGEYPACSLSIAPTGPQPVPPDKQLGLLTYFVLTAGI